MYHTKSLSLSEGQAFVVFISVFAVPEPQEEGLLLMRFISDRQHRDIVKLRRIPDKFLDRSADLLNQFSGTRLGISVQGIEHSVHTEKFRPAAGGFDNAVRIDEKPVAGLQSDLIIGIRDVFHGGHYKPVFVLYDFKGLSIAAQHRIFMSGITGGENTC